jgi:hypothetical protein
MNATLLMLAILFVGCTPPPLKPHVSAAAAEAKVSVALMKLMLEMRKIADTSMANFEAETPTNCQSPHLTKALDVAERSGSIASTLRSRQDAAEMMLDVADRAQKKGCLDVADQTHRQVIANYIGSGYAAYRQRAEIGIADIRAAKTAPVNVK